MVLGDSEGKLELIQVIRAGRVKLLGVEEVEEKKEESWAEEMRMVDGGERNDEVGQMKSVIMWEGLISSLIWLRRCGGMVGVGGGSGNGRGDVVGLARVVMLVKRGGCWCEARVVRNEMSMGRLLFA